MHGALAAPDVAGQLVQALATWLLGEMEQQRYRALDGPD
jgi:hypothetical protein